MPLGSPINYTGSQIAYPIQLGQQKLGFKVASFSITNNTDSTLYLSRSVVSPSASQSDFTIPPRSSQGVFGWYSDTLYIGSSGATVLATDSITIQPSEEASGPFVASAIPITASQVRSIQSGFIGFPAGTGGSVTVAINGVNVAKSFLIPLGISRVGTGAGTEVPDWLVYLASATSVTGVTHAPAQPDVVSTIGFTVVELV